MRAGREQIRRLEQETARVKQRKRCNGVGGDFLCHGRSRDLQGKRAGPRSPSGRGRRAGCRCYGEEVKVALFGAELDCALAAIANWGTGRDAGAPRDKAKAPAGGLR